MNEAITYQLHVPTDQTLTGPYIRLEPPGVFVEYDYERDDGGVNWAKVVFQGVVALSYRDNSCCTASDVVAFNCILAYAESPWLRQVLNRRSVILGGQIDAREEALYRHYLMYFDDAASVEVIAQSFTEQA